MEWPTILLVVLGGVGIPVAIYFFTAKPPGGGSVPGRFDFDRYKESELSRRGLFDKTKWR